MSSQGCVIAVAIEDHVDLLARDGADEYVFTDAIPEGGNYLDEVHRLLSEALRLLIGKLAPRVSTGQVRDLFNTVDALVVSVPGVVHLNRTLLQIPLWHSKISAAKDDTADGFDFAEQLAELASDLISNDSDRWGERERARFISKVFVVNDTSACAAFEYLKRRSSHQPPEPKNVADFVYMKIHNGVNVAVVQPDGGKVELKIKHAEAGHGYPLIHKLDYEQKFKGVCHYHGCCFQGMMAGHSFYTRAMGRDSGPLRAWRTKLEKLQRRGLVGTDLDNELVEYVLGNRQGTSHGTAEGIDLLAHYAAQMAYDLSIGVLSPAQIVIAGRMGTPGVIDAIRKKVVTWARGFPKRDELTMQGIAEHIVPSLEVSSEAATIEVVGAQAIAFSRANMPLDELNASRAVINRIHLNPVPDASNVITLFAPARRSL